jgi:hypothetical protein
MYILSGDRSPNWRHIQILQSVVKCAAGESKSTRKGALIQLCTSFDVSDDGLLVDFGCRPAVFRSLRPYCAC